MRTKRSFRGKAAGDVVDCIHNDLECLWSEVPYVEDIDQMSFTTAVIESATNIVKHAEPSGPDPVELGVDLTVEPTLLQARISAYYAKPPYGPMEPAAAGEDAESGRGLALIRALVTTVSFQREDTTNTWILSRSSRHC